MTQDHSLLKIDYMYINARPCDEKREIRSRTSYDNWNDQRKILGTMPEMLGGVKKKWLKLK